MVGLIKMQYLSCVILLQPVKKRFLLFVSFHCYRQHLMAKKIQIGRFLSTVVVPWISSFRLFRSLPNRDCRVLFLHMPQNDPYFQNARCLLFPSESAWLSLIRWSESTSSVRHWKRIFRFLTIFWFAGFMRCDKPLPENSLLSNCTVPYHSEAAQTSYV